MYVASYMLGFCHRADCLSLFDLLICGSHSFLWWPVVFGIFMFSASRRSLSMIVYEICVVRLAIAVWMVSFQRWVSVSVG